MLKKNFIIVAIMLFAGLFSNKAISRNIALNCSYRYSIAPKYELTIDAGDKKQLTDGKYAPRNNGFLWNNRETVGWRYVGNKMFIVIDLGSDQSISGVSYSTAGGVHGVGFPRKIYILVSNDNKNFYRVGELVGSTPERLRTLRHGYSEITFHNNKLKTHGRYVMICPAAVTGTFQFCDEIKIFSGKPEYLKIPYSGNVYKAAPVKISKMELVEDGCKIRMALDLKNIANEIKKSKLSASQKLMLNKQLTHLKTEIDNFKLTTSLDKFRAVTPLNSIHSKILRILAELRRLQGFKPVTLWSNYRYAPMTLMTVPIKKQPELDVFMLGNEYRAAVFNVSNYSDKKMNFILKTGSIPPLQEVRQLEDLDSRDFRRDEIQPLVKLAPQKDGSYKFSVAAGTTRQIWLGFSSRNVKSGNYSFNIQLKASGFNSKIPGQVKIYPRSLPEKPTISCGLWDYITSNLYGCGSQNRRAAQADMQAHGITITCGHREIASLPDKYDPNFKVDFSKFEEWVKFWPNARRYYIFLCVFDGQGLPKAKLGSEDFKKALAAWARSWDAYLRKHNFRRHQVELNILDEPVRPSQYRTLKQWAKIIKENSDWLAIWMDPVKIPNRELAQETFSYADVLCPVLSLLQRPKDKAIIDATLKRSKKDFFTYRCTGARSSGYVYHREQFWYAFYFGTIGTFMWAYFDNQNKNMWNEYGGTGGTSYAISCVTPWNITTTKRMESLREGMQDYDYLMLLPDSRKAKQLALKTVRKAEAGDRRSKMHEYDQARRMIISQISQ
jgi:hypothetical protein